MPQATHDSLNEELVRTQLQHVTDQEAAWVFLQEPGFIGFGVVRQEAIHWPPNIRPDWSRVFDLRLFGEQGEWHVWPYWDHPWQSRLLRLQDNKDFLTEYHALWGTQARSVAGAWVTLIEDRGATLWLPVTIRNNDLPLRLKLAQIVGYDPKSGLAGIVDAALIALVSASDAEKVIPPPSVL
jgi:CRISPR-associated protein (TIGR03984 family)